MPGLSPYIPILSALGGAIVAAWITISRAQYTAYSSDFSKRIDHALELINRKSECSCLFWLNSADAGELKTYDQYIIGLRDSLTILIDAMDRDYKGFKKAPLINALNDFHCACTGGDFPKHSPDDAKMHISSVLVTAETLKSEIFRARISNYRWIFGI